MGNGVMVLLLTVLSKLAFHFTDGRLRPREGKQFVNSHPGDELGP